MTSAPKRIVAIAMAATLLCAPCALAWGAEAGPRGNFQGSLTAFPSASQLEVRGSHYVPAHSRIPSGSRPSYIPLAATLFIHNTSRDEPLVIDRIDYFDTGGNLVEQFLSEPIAIRPLATIKIFVPENDDRGGTGANFIVSWAGASEMTRPVIEAVMIGTVGTTSYSFVSAGRPIEWSE